MVNGHLKTDKKIEKQIYNKGLVTIVIPAYNAEQFLKENIESVMDQSYQNLEIIYVCDGCTDRTAEILYEYAAKDARIRVRVETTNQGAAISRNIGMSMAAGDWIIFLDADDLFDREMIEEMLNAAVNEQADIAGCYLEYFDNMPNKNALVYNADRKRYCKDYPVIETKKEMGHIMQVMDYSPCTKLVHKSIFKRKEVFFQSMPNTNDVYYAMSAVLHSNRIVYVDKVLLHYRSNKNRNTLSTRRNKKKSYIFEALDQVFESIKHRANNGCLLKSFYNEVFANLNSYLDYDVYDDLFELLKGTYLDRWGMYRDDIWKKLSCINKSYFQNVLLDNKDRDRQKIIMQAKVEFVKEMSEEGCSIWGAGVMGSALLREIARASIKIRHVFDSDPDKWGKEIEGYLVEKFEENREKNIIVTATKFYEEIKRQIGDKVENVVDLDKQIWVIPGEAGEDCV